MRWVHTKLLNKICRFTFWETRTVTRRMDRDIDPSNRREKIARPSCERNIVVDPGGVGWKQSNLFIRNCGLKGDLMRKIYQHARMGVDVSGSIIIVSIACFHCHITDTSSPLLS